MRALLLIAILALQPAAAAMLTLVSLDKGGSLVTEDGDLYAKRSIVRKQYSGYVVVHAVPWRGWQVKNWHRDCKGRAIVCRVKMNGNKVAKVTWERAPEPEEPLTAYTANGDRIGRASDITQTWVSVVTSEGYTVGLNRWDGNPGRETFLTGYDNFDCRGQLYTRENGPGVIALSVTEGRIVWIDFDEARQSVRIYSQFEDGRCENFADGIPWSAYAAKQETSDDISQIGLPPLPFEPVEIR